MRLIRLIQRKLPFWLRVAPPDCFRSRWGEGGAVRREGDYFLDLRGANRGLLEEAGVGVLVDWNICTACSPWMGSFRREKDSYTRMMAYLAPGSTRGFN